MNVFSEKFADIKILRYSVPEFENLDLNRKLYIYYLSQAALCGRDILWDQNNRYNLRVRALLENIWLTCKINRETTEFKTFTVYLKRVWFSNGIHHHYSTEKLAVGFSEDYFDELVAKWNWSNLKLPAGINQETLLAERKNVPFEVLSIKKIINH